MLELQIFATTIDSNGLYLDSRLPPLQPHPFFVEAFVHPLSRVDGRALVTSVKTPTFLLLPPALVCRVAYVRACMQGGRGRRREEAQAAQKEGRWQPAGGRRGRREMGGYVPRARPPQGWLLGAERRYTAV